MTAMPHPLAAAPVAPALHATFLALLPKLQTHAAISFRDVTCPDRRADLVNEVVALAWQWLIRLHARGADTSRFPTAIARLAARAVRSGRRLCGQEKTRDVLSRSAQRRHGFTVEPLSSSTRRSFADIHAVVKGQQALDAYEERLADNTVSPPPEAAAFRIDFPRFLADLSPRDRELAMYLSLGHGGKRAAARFGVSAGRVSQLRRRWATGWRRFQGEDSTADCGTEFRAPTSAPR